MRRRCFGLLIALFGAGLAVGVRAEVYECRTADGTVTLTNVPADPGCRRLGGPAPATPATGRALPVVRLHPAPESRTGGRPSLDLDRLLREAAARSGLDYELVKAVVHVESSFDPLAVSPAGAQGLMQIMPETARDLGLRDAFDPEQNLRAGTRYLVRLLGLLDDDLELALAAYNAGLTTVQRYGGVPDYPETQRYVRRVLNLYRAYKRRAGEPTPWLAWSD